MPSETTILMAQQDHERHNCKKEYESVQLHENDDDSQSNGPSSALQWLVLVAAATAATLGYDVGIIAAAIQPLQKTMALTSVEKEVAMGSLNFVAALGAILGGKIAHEYGRKSTVKVCGWIFIVGTLFMALAPGYWTLLSGRIITGMGVGVSFVVAPVYLSEVAPTHLRGRLNAVFDVAINGGILFGYVVGFCVQLVPGLGDGMKWRIMLGLGMLLPIIVLFNLQFLPESPRWLVMMDRTEEAREVLADLGGTEEPIVDVISSMQEELKLEQEASPGHVSPIQAILKCNCSSGMKLALALGFWQQITGTEAVLYYSADFLQQAGLKSPTERLLGNCFVGLCKLAPELVAMQLVDRLGRRPLMITSAVSLMVTTFLLSASFFLHWHPMIVILLLCSVMTSFSIGLGPFSFLVAAESLGLSERATGVTMCAAINRCTSGTVALTAVSLSNKLGSGGFFAFYGAIGVASLPFYFACLPETTGQSLEELAARSRQLESERSMSSTDEDSAASPANGQMA